MVGAVPRTLAEKVWSAHIVHEAAGEPDLLYVDLHLVHEVTSPQAFEGLRAAGRVVRRPDLTIATEDHNTPTDTLLRIEDPISRTQIEALRKNCAEFGVRLHSLGDAEQGVVHVLGPQSVAIHTPRPTARSVRSRSASAPARSSTSSRPRRWHRTNRRRWRSRSMVSCSPV